MASEDSDNLVLRLLKEMRAETATGFAGVRLEMAEGFAKVETRFAEVDARFAKVDLRLTDLQGLTMKTWNEVRGSNRLALAEQVATMRAEIDAMQVAIDALMQAATGGNK